MTSQDGNRKALVLTVGTGDMDDPEKTLLSPMRKSIDRGEWGRILLLPSRTTEAAAGTLRDRVAGTAVTVDPLPKPGQEDDADQCFAHFDRILGQLMADGFKPGDIVADFTRGTKAMSAALVLAAVGHGVERLRYVHSPQRDSRGMVVPGTEKIGEIWTNVVTARRRVDEARVLMSHGDFGAALALLPDQRFLTLFAEPLRKEAAALRAAARIYAAWDRLDYGSAVAVLDERDDTAHAGAFAPTDKMERWLRRLAGINSFRPPDADVQTYCKDQARSLRPLACDLLANAERRVRDQHFEDAQLRVYRVLELLGQIRLFECGYDNADLPEDDDAIAAFEAAQAKSHRPAISATGRKRTAGRETTAHLLKHLGDPLADDLLRFGRWPQGVRRNFSILIHGFTATARAREELSAALRQIETLLKADHQRAGDWLQVARSLLFQPR